MDIRTYRANTIQEAIQMVRNDLGPDAAVLHTRELGHGWLQRLWAKRRIEVVASTGVTVPSRFAETKLTTSHDQTILGSNEPADENIIPRADAQNLRTTLLENIKKQSELPSVIDELSQRPTNNGQVSHLPQPLVELFSELLSMDFPENLVRELVQDIQPHVESQPEDAWGIDSLKDYIARNVESFLRVTGPIKATPDGSRLIALVGPTGVGKTTTIAKLAANYRLREKRRVGLITVDTYRIAAVEQLRTYADIIDLPMEVVATPREMREAVGRMRNQDLIFLDTAGRSPCDDVRIQELKSILGEAAPDEVHLVISCASSAQGIQRTHDMFMPVGVTATILTKIDEAQALGNVVPMIRKTGIAVSYLTDGQNVPDDIRPAETRSLARLIMNLPN